ncbi:MAG: PadR family transcriptional regulator [TACK group archaeon]|nr:PadR family transcriptional regulator [TACK group archaeon]
MIYDHKDFPYGDVRSSPPPPPPIARDYHGRSGLRGWVIIILGKGPRNGAEIMDEIETMSFGWWRPSPGSLYPALEAMVKEGVIKKREDGRYELTESGKDEFNKFRRGRTSTPENIEEMITNMEGYLSYMEEQGKGAVQPYAESLRKVAQRINKLVGE